MAFNAQNTEAFPGTANTTNPTATGVGAGQTGYGQTGAATEGQHHHHHHHSGVGEGIGGGNVCSPQHVFKADAAVEKTTRHIDDDRAPQRVFEAPIVQENIVHHDVERVRPIIHQEVHQTRLHEGNQHKVEAPIDMGVTEVINHRDTDPCGNRVSEDLNAVRGTGTTTVPTGGLMGGTGTGAGLMGAGHHNETGRQGGVKGALENVKETAKEKLTGRTDGEYGRTGAAGYGNERTTGREGEYGSTGYGNTAATGTGVGTGTAASGYGTTGTDAYNSSTATGAYNTAGTGTNTAGAGYGNTNAYNSNSDATATISTGQEPGGIKGLINKVIPGPGPFKQVGGHTERI